MKKIPVAHSLFLGLLTLIGGTTSSVAGLLRDRCIDTVFDHTVELHYIRDYSQNADYYTSGKHSKEFLDRFRATPPLSLELQDLPVVHFYSVNPWIPGRIPHVGPTLGAFYLLLQKWQTRIGEDEGSTLGDLEKVIPTVLERFRSGAKLYDEKPKYNFYGENARGLNPIAPQNLRTQLSAPQTREDEAHSSTFAHIPQMLGICGRYFPAQILTCERALNDLSNQYATGGNLNLPSLGGTFLGDILSSDRPTRGALKALEIIYQKFKFQDFSGNLMTDVRGAYLLSGYPAAEAEKWAWDFILLATIHGQNGEQAFGGIRTPYNFGTQLAASLVSGLLSYFDAEMDSASGKLYSLPPGVTSECNNGKPYHFWVSAYASRYLTGKHYSPEIAAGASYLLEVGYQMLSVSYGRRPEQTLASLYDAPINDKNRIDLSFSAAGAAYGTYSAPMPLHLSVSDAYETMFHSGKRLKPDTYTVPSPLFMIDWLRMMAPETALNQMLHELPN